MPATLFRRYLGLSAAVCVLLLFFFPLLQGPFQATHGPTTDFRAKQAFLVLAFTILLAAAAVFAVTAFRGSEELVVRNVRAPRENAFPTSRSVMRC